MTHGNIQKIQEKMNLYFRNIKYLIGEAGALAKNILLYQTIRRKNYIIFEKEKIIYIPIEKCAHTSIKKCLQCLLGEPEKSKNIPIHEIKFPTIHKLKPRHLDWSYTIFMVIRNPLERLVSCYFNRIKTQIDTVKTPWYKNTDKNNKTVHYLFGYLVKNTETLEKFLFKITNIPKLFMEGHFRPMADFIGMKNITPQIKIIKMDELADGFEPIRKKYKLPLLEFHNKTDEDKRMIIQALPEKLIKKIKKIYREDYELYNQANKN